MFSPFANYRPSSWDPEDELAEEILAGEVLGGSLRSKRARLEAVDAIAAALAAAAPPPSPLCLDMRAAAPGVVTLRVELPGRQLAVRNTGHCALASSGHRLELPLLDASGACCLGRCTFTLAQHAPQGAGGSEASEARALAADLAAALLRQERAEMEEVLSRVVDALPRASSELVQGTSCASGAAARSASACLPPRAQLQLARAASGQPSDASTTVPLALQQLARGLSSRLPSPHHCSGSLPAAMDAALDAAFGGPEYSSASYGSPGPSQGAQDAAWGAAALGSSQPAAHGCFNRWSDLLPGSPMESSC